MRGNLPAMAASVGKFGIGLGGIAKQADVVLEPFIKDETKRSFASKMLGLFTANFFVSPLFNLSRQMKMSQEGVVNSLKAMNLVYDPSKYNDICTVNSKVGQLLLGLPVDPKTPEGIENLKIKPYQYVKLNLVTLARNYPCAWKGYLTATLVIFMSCLTLTTALEIAKKLTLAPAKKLTSDFVNEPVITDVETGKVLKAPEQAPFIEQTPVQSVNMPTVTNIK